MCLEQLVVFGIEISDRYKKRKECYDITFP